MKYSIQRYESNARIMEQTDLDNRLIMCYNENACSELGLQQAWRPAVGMLNAVLLYHIHCLHRNPHAQHLDTTKDIRYFSAISIKE